MVNSKGRAYTQRVEPKLAPVEVELPKEAFSEGWEPNNNSYLGTKIAFNFFSNYTLCMLCVLSFFLFMFCFIPLEVSMNSRFVCELLILAPSLTAVQS